MTSILGIVASSKLVASGSYESIASFTAAGSETAFNFTSIPSTYKHLQLRILSRRTTGINAVVALQFNGDTGSNYWWHLLEGNGSTVTASSVSFATTRVQTFWMNPTVNLADQFGAGVIDIIDYASTSKNKTVRAFGGGDANGTGKINLASGLWSNTNAITSINVYFLGDAVVANSVFSLYGIRG